MARPWGRSNPLRYQARPRSDAIWSNYKHATMSRSGPARLKLRPSILKLWPREF